MGTVPASQCTTRLLAEQGLSLFLIPCRDLPRRAQRMLDFNAVIGAVNAPDSGAFAAERRK